MKSKDKAKVLKDLRREFKSMSQRTDFKTHGLFLFAYFFAVNYMYHPHEHAGRIVLNKKVEMFVGKLIY